MFDLSKTLRGFIMNYYEDGTLTDEDFREAVMYAVVTSERLRDRA